MKLHRNYNFRQHKALQLLEQCHPDVFYVTSQISTQNELSKAYLSDTVIDDASAIFSPLNIQLPNYTDEHYVSFKAGSAFGRIYSEVGEKFPRKHYSPRDT
jgi:hypothetical protein